MDLTQLDKIKGFSNWMDRKPRAWLLFVLSAGVVLLGYGYIERGKLLDKCHDEKDAALQRANDTYRDLFDSFLDLKQQAAEQADSVKTLKEKAKSVIQEVKKKL